MFRLAVFGITGLLLCFSSTANAESIFFDFTGTVGGPMATATLEFKASAVVPGGTFTLADVLSGEFHYPGGGYVGAPLPFSLTEVTSAQGKFDSTATDFDRIVAFDVEWRTSDPQPFAIIGGVVADDPLLRYWTVAALQPLSPFGWVFDGGAGVWVRRPAPEPFTLLLLGLGLAGVFAMKARKEGAL